MSRRQLIAAIKKLASPQFMNTYDVSSTVSHGVLTRLYDSLVSDNSTITSNQTKHHHHDHDHHHRTYATIRKLLQTLNYLSELSSHTSIHEIAKAESNIHSVPISGVHFHEVGAVDSIVDTVGVILGLDMMLKRGINCVVRSVVLCE